MRWRGLWLRWCWGIVLSVVLLIGRCDVAGGRLEGVDRDEVAAVLAREYLAGASVRALSQRHGFSYGKVHSLLSSRVTLRPRGGRGGVEQGGGEG